MKLKNVLLRPEVSCKGRLIYQFLCDRKRSKLLRGDKVYEDIVFGSDYIRSVQIMFLILRSVLQALLLFIYLNSDHLWCEYEIINAPTEYVLNTFTDTSQVYVFRMKSSNKS